MADETINSGGYNYSNLNERINNTTNLFNETDNNFDYSKFARASESLESSLDYNHQIMISLMGEKERIESEMRDVQNQINLIQEKIKVKRLEEQVLELEDQVVDLQKKLDKQKKKNKLPLAEEPMKKVRSLVTLGLEGEQVEFFCKGFDVPEVITDKPEWHYGPSSYFRAKFSNFTFTPLDTVFGTDKELKEALRKLRCWLNRAFDPQSGESDLKKNIVRDIDIKRLDPTGCVIDHYKLCNCMPLEMDEWDYENYDGEDVAFTVSVDRVILME